ncbi:uncharacterized protein BT62DRAFT_384938 [Guyanagaster necrorhizus]|uniref:Uncharacterized protein n=1 Tax=Guyanagaster necrorhizus TaxID=856835 RepID=A0A9P8ANN4_9AGAR|nr:uncharacterized protein BT62DRAFT_384938 [Guyanagaster necrorhizus MCA 3950]KAG7442488.1 hypothetical protein BT62DRAFT_384938 [Guyanagaster necrorhizus MCA 3950]
MAPVVGSVSPTQTALNAARPGNFSLHPYLPSPAASLSPLLAMFDYLQPGLTAAFHLHLVLSWRPRRSMVTQHSPGHGLYFGVRSTFMAAIGFAPSASYSRSWKRKWNAIGSKCTVHCARGRTYARALDARVCRMAQCICPNDLGVSLTGTWSVDCTFA